jgi:hypothetical protein
LYRGRAAPTTIDHKGYAGAELPTPRTLRTKLPVTSDFIVDMLERWWAKKRKRFPEVDTLVINQDNGPEIQSRRTQFLKRMVEFAWTHALLIRLAYYPRAVAFQGPVNRKKRLADIRLSVLKSSAAAWARAARLTRPHRDAAFPGEQGHVFTNVVVIR